MSFWKTDNNFEYFPEENLNNYSQSITHTYDSDWQTTFVMNDSGRLTMKTSRKIEDVEDTERKTVIVACSRAELKRLISWLIRTYKQMF